MEGLQMAQIIADLSTLQNVEPAAAQNLLNANKDLSPKTLRRKSKASLLPEPPKFDKLGRRIIRASSYNGSMTPTRPDMFGRIGSNISSSSSGVATPNVQTPAEEQEDIDMARAKKLLELYEMRGKFREMGDTGLARAKERVDKVVEKYNKKELEEREKVARSRYLGV
ncbi:hypothetical protein BGZ60DRAFT_135096 [Tricladium varicosporioides]|nr:hypothetical protein BGZ60DRAFT_135096 [Hymenoscyphus varicosporioides]